MYFPLLKGIMSHEGGTVAFWSGFAACTLVAINLFNSNIDSQIT